MADLFNQQISATYSGLLKTSSSGVLSASLAQITDGRGNVSQLYLSTTSVQFYGLYTFPNSNGSDGQVLKTDGAGVLTWEDDANSGTVTSVALSVPTGLTVTGSPITTSGTITIGGTLGVANGGTGATTLTGILVGNGTSAISAVTDGTVGQVLSTNGSGTYSFIDSGTGDVTADGASVASRVAVWNNTTGELRGTSAIATVNSNVYLIQPSTNGTDKFNYIIGGAFAINENDFGIQNTGFGDRVLNSSDFTGNNNTAFGSESQTVLTTGLYNTSIGSFAMYDNRSGSYNVGLGGKTMFNQRISNYNVAIGYDSMDGVSASQTAISNYNTAVGHESLQSIQGGDNNTVVGYNSGSAITTGSNNVIIGSNTGSTITTSSNNIIISDGDGNIRQSFDVNGDATFNGKVGINSNSSSAGNATGVRIEQAGTGDSVISFLLTGVSEWLVGVDNSDGDRFKINNVTGGSDFNNTGLSITTAGAATFNGSVSIEGSSTGSLNNLSLVNSSTSPLLTKQNNLSFKMTDTVGTIKNAFQLTAYSDSAGGNIENGGLIFSGRKADSDTEFMRISSGGTVNIPLGTRPTTGKGGALIVGGDADGTGLTTNTRKLGLITCPSFNNSNGNMAMVTGDTSSSTVAKLAFGSINTGYASPTQISFHTTSTVGLVGTEKFTITSGGNFEFKNGALKVGDSTTAELLIIPSSNGFSPALLQFHKTDSAVQTVLQFLQNNTEKGSITYSGTSTAYNTISDYRVKENVTPITDALSRVNQLKPSRFNFIADADNTVDGFLAHEVENIIPEAIKGEKDAMKDEEFELTPRVEEVIDEDGNVITEAVEAVMETRSVPDYQGIDQSKIVPLLTAAIQEQQTIIEDLKSRIETLEG